jgi:peptidoglycan/LPS O-acetylase OafA/YrhL
MGSRWPTGRMLGSGSARQGLRILFVLTAATGIGFVAIILSSIASGIEVHELAGAILLAELLAALVLALALGRSGRDPQLRAAIGLLSVVLAAILGASLAAGSLPQNDAGLPLLPLAVLILVAVDGVRVTSPSRPTAAPTS